MPLPADVTLRDAEPFVGLPYVPGSFDCMHLALEVQAKLFGRYIRDPLGAHHPCGTRAQERALHLHRETLAELVAQPQTGDAVLFVEPQAGGQLGYHIGTVFMDHTQRCWVLHTRFPHSSLLQPLSVCQNLGLQVEGFYRWK